MNKFVSKALVAAAAVSASAAFATSTNAGDASSAFDQVYEMLAGWTTGTLGKLIALGALATGLGIGLARQSVMAVVIGIAMACAFANADTVIDKIITASGDAAVVTMENGMQ